MIKEFKEFISRGNVVELAVGVVVGSAFSKIVTSLVNDIIMPTVGIIIGGINFTGLTLKVKDSTIAYGSFIQNIIDFLIIAACIFLFVKAINKITKKKKEEKKEIIKTEEVILLQEIRDLLKNNQEKTKK